MFRVLNQYLKIWNWTEVFVPFIITRGLGINKQRKHHLSVSNYSAQKKKRVTSSNNPLCPIVLPLEPGF